MKTSGTRNPSDDFVRELTANSQPIYGFIFTLVPNRADADEIFQETSVLLWQKFDTYVPGTNFRAWAFRVAANKVREYHRNQKKHVKYFQGFTDEFIDAVDQRYQARVEDLEDRTDILVSCLEKLDYQDRDLITRRYQDFASVKSVAASLDRSAKSIYKALNRVHTRLLHCVQTNLVKGEQ